MDNFISLAKTGKNGVGRYLASLLIIFIFWQVIGALPLGFVSYGMAENVNEFLNEADASNWAGLYLNKNLYLFLMLIPFAFGLLGLYIAITQIHKRSFSSLVYSKGPFDFSRMTFAFLLWGSIASAMTFLEILSEQHLYEYQLEWLDFIPLLVISFSLITIQSGFEEVFFRGYLLQGIALISKHRWVPYVVISILFGLMHGMNPEVQKLGPLMYIYYIGTGFFFGTIVMMDNRLELVIGLHAINNIISAVFVTADWSVLQTHSLFRYTGEPELTWMSFSPLFITYPLVLFILSKKYKWTNWRANLLGPIQEEA